MRRSPSPRARLELTRLAHPRGAATPLPRPQTRTARQDRLHYLRVLYRRRWLALTIFLAIVGVAAERMWSAPRLYQATARMHLEAAPQNVVAMRPVITERRRVSFETQVELLRSRAVAQETVEALALSGTPLGAAAAPERRSLMRTVTSAPSRLAAWGNRVLGRSSAQIRTEAPPPGEPRAQSRAIAVLLGGLVVRPVEDSRMIEVAFRSTDPDLAARVVNAHVQAYTEHTLEYKALAAREAGGWLDARLEEQRKEVEQAERALQAHRERHGAPAVGDGLNVVTRKLADLNGALTEAKLDRLAKEGEYALLRESQNDRAALDALPAIMSSLAIQQQRSELATIGAELAQLSGQLGDKHPRIVALRKQLQAGETKLRAEVLKTVERVRIEYETAVEREKTLGAAVARQVSEAHALDRNAIQASAIEHQVASTRRIYQSLQRRAREADVLADLRATNVRVIDAAERPQSPYSPTIARTMTRAVAAGVFMAVVVAFLFEFLDNRIKHPNQIGTLLGVPALGYLPLLAKPQTGEDILLTRGVTEQFAEALRGIGANLLFSDAQEGSRTVLVTSTGPGEGKTLVATNLAVSLAQAGQRVLLIDADMRRPRVHAAFGMEQEPGLSNLMVGQEGDAEAVRDSEVPGLRVLTAGRVPPNPAELVGSARFREFMTSAAGDFDWIVIDSPPIMAVTDAAILARGVSGVLFVVRANATSRHAARTALDQLDGPGVRVYGCVLNGVDLDRHAYYYSQIYKREYGAYYGQAPEESPRADT